MLQQAFLESTHLVTSQTESASQEFNIPADGSQVRELPHQQLWTGILGKQEKHSLITDVLKIPIQEERKWAAQSSFVDLNAIVDFWFR